LVLHAFIDDSWDSANNGGTFVLAGYIAFPEAWAKFAKEWEEMLPHATLNSDDHYHFKMSEMAKSPERLSRVPGFYRIIERHVLASISCVVNVIDLERAKNRVVVINAQIDWGWMNNNYKFGFRALVDVFHRDKLGAEIAKVIPSDEQIDFIFDNQTEKKSILETWQEYIATRTPEQRAMYGASPRFEDDIESLQLQAADFWAWWVRKWSRDGQPYSTDGRKFEHWEEQRSIPNIMISFTEDQIFETLINGVRQYAPGARIYDRKTGLPVKPSAL
jgi:hypothetical protein